MRQSAAALLSSEKLRCLPEKVFSAHADGEVGEEQALSLVFQISSWHEKQDGKAEKQDGFGGSGFGFNCARELTWSFRKYPVFAECYAVVGWTAVQTI